MSVTLHFHGAARTVTGSCLRFEAPGAHVLVDCGMFQGPKTLKALNHEPFPFDPASLDAVLLTHAHIDHSGLLPRLVKQGFRGAIHATPATIELCACLLPDSGHIQESEVRMLNRRNRRRWRGRDEVQPIYGPAEAEAALEAFQPVAYGEWITPAPGLRARWWNAGHMLGSASIEMEFGDVRVLASGDIGPDDGTLHPEPEGPRGLDHLICESTYGDEDRPIITPEARRAALAALVREAAAQDGALLIPSFAVERAQEVVLDLALLMQRGEIPATTIHMDSPLATRASKVFARHAQGMEEGEALRAALHSHRLVHVVDGASSRKLTKHKGFHIVIAGSGMCDAGRIREHLKSRLWDARAMVVLVGYQASGTLGRLLEGGAPRVRIQGETIEVAARVTRIEGYSGHADAPELVRWVEARRPVAGGIFLTHGEPEAIAGLAARLPGHVVQPVLDSRWRLSHGTPPEELPAPPTARRLHPEEVGRPDWHNDRAALMLGVEEAIERAPDETARAALIARLRAALLGQAGA